MVVKSDCGIWMQDEQRFISVARAIAVDAMLALKLDPAADFMTRDKIIAAISDRVQRTLDEVSQTVAKENADSDFDEISQAISASVIHPKDYMARRQSEKERQKNKLESLAAIVDKTQKRIAKLFSAK